jgi:hypothetical protein
MQQQLIATYNDLMSKLGSLPVAIEQVQIELTAAKLDLERDEKALKDIEVNTRGEGSNDDQRKADKAAKLKADIAYARFAQAADAGRREVAVLAAQVDSLTRQYSAVTYQAKLHAALLEMVTGAGLKPQDVNFYSPAQLAAMPAPHITPNGANSGHTMTAADAADLGL